MVNCELFNNISEEEYKYIEVDFMSQDEMDRTHPEANDRAVKQDDYLKRAEMQEVEKYRDTYYLPYEVEVASVTRAPFLIVKSIEYSFALSNIN